MAMIVWIVLGLGLGLIASKVVSTTGEGTVVDILLGIVGALAAGWLFSLFGGTDVNGFDIDSVYGAGAAVIGAIILLALYHVFLRRRMRWRSVAELRHETAERDQALLRVLLILALVVLSFFGGYSGYMPPDFGYGGGGVGMVVPIVLLVLLLRWGRAAAPVGRQATSLICVKEGRCRSGMYGSSVRSQRRSRTIPVPLSCPGEERSSVPRPNTAASNATLALNDDPCFLRVCYLAGFDVPKGETVGDKLLRKPISNEQLVSEVRLAFASWALVSEAGSGIRLDPRVHFHLTAMGDDLWWAFHTAVGATTRAGARGDTTVRA
jgi:uncharacterized membrane protein YeaQ/YmgE (transglycosylase-associated protein family)